MELSSRESLKPNKAFRGGAVDKFKRVRKLEISGVYLQFWVLEAPAFFSSCGRLRPS